MNQLKLSLRCGDNPKIIREENGIPTFATVFALHQPRKRNNAPENTIPITVKASRDLAPALVENLSKGVAFVVEGQLSFFRNPETRRETFSIWAEKITEIVQPKATSAGRRSSSD